MAVVQYGTSGALPITGAGRRPSDGDPDDQAQDVPRRRGGDLESASGWTFARGAALVRGSGASLRAEALADSPAQVVGLGAVGGTPAWAPTAPLSTGASDLLLNPNGAVKVRLRFSADDGNWTIDDIFIDPRKMG